MSGSSFTNLFGSNAIKPAQPSFEALTIAVNTPLAWPLESTEGVPSLAAQMNVSATSAGLDLLMPSGSTGSNGAQSLISNTGANSFTVTDAIGNQIAVLAPSQTWLISLTDNTTPSGTWAALQIGATTSSADAGSLAGPGLVANGATLETELAPVTLSANATLTSANRANAIVWTGAAGTLQLDPIASLTAGWYCAVTNEGTGTLTITGTGGETVNGGASLVLQIGNGGLIVCSSSGFNSYGAIPASLGVANGGTGAATPAGALTNLGGTAIGQSVFTAPNASAIVSLLGLTASLLTEHTIATNQTLAAASSGSAFLCSTALTITLPLSSTLTSAFLIVVSAIGTGAVTLTPQTLDHFHGGSNGGSFVLAAGTSSMFMTDAAGAWFSIFAALPLTGGQMSGSLIASGGIVLPSGVSLLAADPGGIQHPLLNISQAAGSNFTDIWNVGGGPLRFLNQAGNAVLFQTDNVGNVTVYGNLTTAGGVTCPSILLGNNQSIQAKNASGIYHNLLDVASDNSTNIYNAGGGRIRFLNQAGTVELIASDNAGNASIAGSLGLGSSLTIAGDPNFALYKTASQYFTLQFQANQYIQFDTTYGTRYGTTGTHQFIGAVQCDNYFTVDGGSTLVGTVTCNAINCTTINTQGYGITATGGLNCGGGTVTAGTVAAGTVNVSGNINLTGAMGGTFVGTVSTNAGTFGGTCSGSITGQINTAATVVAPAYQFGAHSFGISWAPPNAALFIDGTNVGLLSYTPSDYRLKHSIADAPAGALERVALLRPVTYRFRDIGAFHDDGQTREGFIAHELAEHVPSAVDGEKDAVDESGEMLPQSLHVMPLIALLTKALQEATARIEALEAAQHRTFW